MPGWYEKWMTAWETRLTERDTNRVVRPFEWGVDWTRNWPLVNGNFPATGSESKPENDAAHGDYMLALNQEIVGRSEEFFSYTTPADFRMERRAVEVFATRSNPKSDARQRRRTAEFLRFTSPARTPYEENNLANARWFPAPEKKRTKRAVVVLPHWNSDALSHNVLCRALNWFGISALRLSMPYHDIRRPKELARADYAVSANVGRTIDAARQAVIDLRCCLDWLEQQGYSEFGVLGTSLGSCYAFIASAHDARLGVNVFNHASTYFADVVWLGQSTRHIRAGVEPAIALDDLRRAWLAISPTAYVDLFAAKPKASLVIHARYDLTFPPQFSRQVVAEFARRNFDFEEVELPCGHYTTGETPFKFLDAYHIVRFMVRRLGRTIG